MKSRNGSSKWVCQNLSVRYPYEAILSPIVPLLPLCNTSATSPSSSTSIHGKSDITHQSRGDDPTSAWHASSHHHSPNADGQGGTARVNQAGDNSRQRATARPTPPGSPQDDPMAQVTNTWHMDFVHSSSSAASSRNYCCTDSKVEHCIGNLDTECSSLYATCTNTHFCEIAFQLKQPPAAWVSPCVTGSGPGRGIGSNESIYPHPLQDWSTHPCPVTTLPLSSSTPSPPFHIPLPPQNASILLTMERTSIGASELASRKGLYRPAQAFLSVPPSARSSQSNLGHFHRDSFHGTRT